MKAKLVLAMACAAALSQAAVAQQLAGSSPLHPLGPEQARQAGIELVARSFNLSPEAAASRINVESRVPGIAANIRALYADRLAGIYVDHAAGHRLVVRLTGSDAVPNETYQFGADQLVVDYQVGAEHTLADLQSRFDGGFASLQRRMSGLQSGYVDERTGEIVLEVTNDAAEATAGGSSLSSAAARQSQLVDNPFGVATRIEPMGRIENQVIRGSGDMAFTQSTLSGGVNLTCTGAFTVKDNSSPAKYGLLTAGHCQAASGSYNYTEAAGGGTTATLTHVARRFDASTDVGWAMISTNASDAANTFYTGGTYGWVTQGTPLSKSSTTVGLSMCHYGVTTNGGSCGTVASTAYNPGNICGTGLGIYTGTSACNAVYVAVDSMACAPSDSGGPVYTVTATPEYRPAGVHKAGNTASGRCVYSTTDDISGSPLNLSIL